MPILPESPPFVQRLLTAGALTITLAAPVHAADPSSPSTPLTPPPSPVAPTPPTAQGYRLWQRTPILLCANDFCDKELPGLYVPFQLYPNADSCNKALQPQTVTVRR